MAFRKLEHGERLSTHHFWRRKDLTELAAGGPDDGTREFHAVALQARDRPVDILDAHRDMVKDLVAEGAHPPRNDAGFPTGVRIGLIHEESGIAGFAIDLRVPVVVLQCFIIRISQRDERLGAPIDVQRAQRHVIDDRIESHTGLLEQASEDLGRPIARHILGHHPFEQSV
jgi:hypothetical protein